MQLKFLQINVKCNRITAILQQDDGGYIKIGHVTNILGPSLVEKRGNPSHYKG
jgi:hypothetical protein